MKIDLSSVGAVYKRATVKEKHCWVCQEVLGYKSVQVWLHAKYHLTDKWKVAAQVCHAQILARGRPPDLKVVYASPLPKTADAHELGKWFEAWIWGKTVGPNGRVIIIEVSRDD